VLTLWAAAPAIVSVIVSIMANAVTRSFIGSPISKPSLQRRTLVRQQRGRKDAIKTLNRAIFGHSGGLWSLMDRCKGWECRLVVRWIAL
jgi:hypothetical protein